jgi:ferritin-like metal-binding protein YciE
MEGLGDRPVEIPATYCVVCGRVGSALYVAHPDVHLTRQGRLRVLLESQGWSYPGHPVRPTCPTCLPVEDQADRGSRDQVAEANRGLVELSRTLSEAQGERDQARRALRDALAAKHRSLDQRDTMSAANDALAQEVRDLRTKLAEAKAELDRIPRVPPVGQSDPRAALCKANRDLTALAEQVARAQKDRSDLANANNSQAWKIRDLEGRLGETLAELAAVRDRVPPETPGAPVRSTLVTRTGVALVEYDSARPLSAVQALAVSELGAMAESLEDDARGAVADLGALTKRQRREAWTTNWACRHVASRLRYRLNVISAARVEVHK